MEDNTSERESITDDAKDAESEKSVLKEKEQEQEKEKTEKEKTEQEEAEKPKVKHFYPPPVKFRELKLHVDPVESFYEIEKANKKSSPSFLISVSISNVEGRGPSCHSLLLNLFVTSKSSTSSANSSARLLGLPYARNKTITYRYAEASDYILMSAGIIGSIMTGLSAPANTFLFGDLTNALINYIPGDEEDFLDDVDSFALNNTMLGVAVLLTSYFSIVLYNYSIRRQIFRIRLLYFRAALRQEITFYDIYGTGEFGSRISEDLNKLEDGISEKVLQVVHSMSAFVGCAILSLIDGWELALISLSAIPIIIISIKGLSFLSKRFSKTELQAYAKAGSVAQEVLSSIKTVVAFSGQKKEKQRYDTHLLLAMKNNIRRGLFNGIVFGILWLIIYIAYGTAFWFGIQFVVDEKYTAGQMTTVFFSVIVGTLNLLIIGPFIELFSSAKVAGGTVFWVIDRRSAIDPTSEIGLTPEITGSIEFKNVYFTYPTRPDIPVLKGISLTVNVGETVALVGSSGSGKSTCVQLIQRFYDTTDGELLIDGYDISSINVSYLRQHIGVVGQEPVLFSTTIKENILYAKEDATDAEITAACEMANAHHFISKLPRGYDTSVGDRGAQLSGGQKQRIAIARALIRNPRILLLDEATSALDNDSESKVQKALDIAAKGRTTIIVAHRLSTIRQAEKIVVLSKGEIVETGTHEELYKKEGHYFHLITTQLKRVEEEHEGSDENLEGTARRQSLGPDGQESPTTSKTDHVLDTETVPKVPLKELMRLNAPEWKWLLTGTTASMLIGCCYPIFSIIFGDIMMNFEYPREVALNQGKILCTAFVIVGAAMAVGTFAQIWTYAVAGEKLTMRLRSQTFAAMLRQEMGWFDEKENNVSVLCSRLSNDTSNVQCATGQPLGSLVQAGLTILLAISFSLFFQWKLGMITLCLGPVLIGGSYFMFRNLKGGTSKTQKALETSAKIAIESIGNIRTVAGLCREDALFAQYKRELRPARKVALKSAQSKGIIMGAARSLMFFSYAVCMFYGGRLIAYEGVHFADIFKVTQTLIITSFSVAQAFAFATNFQKGLLSASKIYTVLTRQTKIKSPDMEEVHQDWTAEGDVTYENITFSYPTRPQETVLKGFNLEILRGKRVALVGQSGCGKSTIIQLLERFYDPDEGKVTLDDHDLRRLKLNHLRRQLGIVSQEPVLFDRTIGENIAYGDNERNIPEGEIIDAAEKANAHGFISSLPLGYDTPLGENGIRLSGGQKQRVAIARALVRKPKVLLLDEATSALDTESEKIVQEALDKASFGRTCIMIAHRLSTVIDADKIIVISKGTIADEGTHSELLSKKGIYRRLYSLQGKL